MRFHYSLGTCLLAACAFSPAFAKKPAVVVVGGCEAHPNYATIQSAIDNSPPGTEIDVCPGTYPEQLSIGKSLMLYGVAFNNSNLATVTVPSGGLVTNATDLDNQQPIEAQIVVSNAAAVIIKGLTVDGTGNGDASCGTGLNGILFQNASGSVLNSAVLNTAQAQDYFGCQNGLGIYVQSNGGTSSVTISNNVVEGYQKDGITVTDSGTKATITKNTVIGAGPNAAIAQNGIEIDSGAAATIMSNTVSGDVYTGPYYGASGILVYDAPSAAIKLNAVTQTQFGAVVYEDALAAADGATVSNNSFGGNVTYDAIDMCASNATISGNAISGGGESGVHLDSTCGQASTGDTVTANAIDSACAAFLIGAGSGNVGTNPAPINVANVTLSGDVCPAAPSGMIARIVARHPSPWVRRASRP